ncbi:tetratricopeptide repeat protein [Reichenbachiella sp.]|uniref:tetratricopeptide repeat protein n=1 Tax=Reichenbachiella sp. TaxID=2184521 RepID=UPI003B5C40CA
MNDPILDKLIEEVEANEASPLELMSAFVNMVSESNFQKTRYYKPHVLKYLDSETYRGQHLACSGVAAFFLTEFEDAKDQLVAAIDILKHGDVCGLAHMVLGATYRSLGEIDLAVKELHLSLDMLKPDGHFPVFYSYAFYQLGELHQVVLEFETAKKYYSQGLDFIESHPQKTAEFRFLNGLANVYSNIGEMSLAKKYLDKCLNVKDISLAEKSRGLCDLGIYFFNREELEDSKKSLEESLKLRKKASLEDASATSMIELARTLIGLDEYDEAISLLKKALTIVTKFNSTAKKIKCYLLLANCYTYTNKYKDATSFYSKYIQLNTEFQADREREVFKLKNKQIADQKEIVDAKNIELKDTLEELARVKRSRKAIFFSIITAIFLVLLTEVFLDPIIESNSYNSMISLLVKVCIALLLKPMESIYEKILFKKAIKLTDNI